MLHLIKRGRGLSAGLLGMLAFADPASALVIAPTFDPSITGLANAIEVENAIQSAIDTIDGLYGNAGTVPVLFKYSAGVGNGGSTASAGTTLAYSTYRSLLAANASANPSNLVLGAAIASLPSTLSSNIRVPNVMARIILGVSGATPCYNASGSFVSGCNQSYDAVVTLGNLYYVSPGAGYNTQAVNVVEHELNEVLGVGGTSTTLGSGLGPSTIGTTDLYRYHSSGSGCTTATGLTHTLSYTSSTSEVACYSTDGGTTAVAQLNQTGTGDLGDFLRLAGGPYQIQDYTTNGSDVIPVYTTSSPEYIVMQSIGYTASVPEPTALAWFLSALAGLRMLRTGRPELAPVKA